MTRKSVIKKTGGSKTYILYVWLLFLSNITYNAEDLTVIYLALTISSSQNTWWRMKVLEARIMSSFESPKLLGKSGFFVYLFSTKILRTAMVLRCFTYLPPMAKYKWNGVRQGCKRVRLPAKAIERQRRGINACCTIYRILLHAVIEYYS